MTISRTTHKTVTFVHPFQLAGYDNVFPAGSYPVDTREELIEGVSFNAYRRVSTELHAKVKLRGIMVEQTLNVKPADLDAALDRDLRNSADARM
jgi:hypothetical protein